MTPKTYVCKRARLAGYLMSLGYQPYKITANKDNPRYDVYLFDGSEQLYRAVISYVTQTERHNKERYNAKINQKSKATSSVDERKTR